MGKLIHFPPRKPILPTRAEMVEEAAILLMKEVSNVFIEQHFEQTAQFAWFTEIRQYLWREELLLTEDLDFREADVRRWRRHWRAQAVEYILSKSVR